MKKRLILLSDLYGDLKNDLDTISYKKEELHTQFINYGINTAVEKLIALEPNEIDVLAFSIGGAIVWKAALKGLRINKMLAISATRLRHELSKPSCEINLIYGEQDSFKPSREWFEKMNIDYNIIKGFGHEVYRDNKNIASLCAEIKK